MSRADTMIVDDVELKPLGKGQAELEAALKRLQKQKEDFARLCAEPASRELMRNLEPDAIRYDRYRWIGARVLQAMFARLLDDQRGLTLQQPDGPYTPPSKPIQIRHLAFVTSGLLQMFIAGYDKARHDRLWLSVNAPPWELGTLFHA